MSSEFTLDIQLTELGFSSWDFPICEPQSVKETVLPTQTSIEKSLPETQKFAYSNEDASIVPSGSAENSFLQDHQYSSPIKENAGVITENAENNSETTPTEEKERVTFHNKWKRKRKELGDLTIDDIEQEQSQEKSTNEMDQHSEMSKKTSSLQIDDDDDDDEEKTDEDTEFDFTDEEEDEEEEVEDGDDGDDGDDMSNSEMNGSGENEENYCHVCDITFPSLFLLREHLNMHAGVRPYRCDECNKQFCQLVNYRAHLRSHSQKASIHCKVCSTVFETEELLQQHLDTNHFENEFYQCDFCKQIFTDLEVCQDHVDKHRQEAKRHLCLKCGSSFRHRNSLLQHLQWHSRGIFSCPDCERTFSSKGSLLRHSFSHLGVLPYTCLKCKRHFRLPSLYRNHECKPEQVQCMACLVFFQSQEDFDKHKKETGCWGHQGALPSKTDEIRCMECGQVCASVEELKKHGSTHQRVLKCAECGMGFRSSLMLMSHMGGHAAQRPCLCKDCGLGFPHQQGYDSHLKTCGLETPPVATAKKTKLKKPPSPKKPKSIASNVAQDSSLVTLSQNKVIQTIPLVDQKSTADGVWKFSLNKDHPPGVPLVMLFPVPVTQSSSTSKPAKISQNILHSSLVLEPPSSGPCVISMPVVQPSPVVCKASEKDMTGQSGTNIPANILIQMNIDNGSSKNKWTILKNKKSEVGKDAVKPHQGQTVAAQPEEENKQNSLKNEQCALINDEKHENVNKMSLSSKDCDSSSVTADGGVPLNIIGESLVTSSSPVSQIELNKLSKNLRFCKETVSPDSTSVNSMSDLTWTGDDSDNSQQEGYTCDVEVEVDEEVEIADEDSGVDMLEGELHECVTCGQVLPEKDMIQHYMKHAAVSDTPCLSSNKCASHTTEQSTSCSPSRKRQRSDTEL